MKRVPTPLAIGAVAAVAAAMLLSGCGTEYDDDDCRTATPVVMFFGTDGHYHYGSTTGKVVPADKVPADARKAPGYKAPAAPAAPPKPATPPKAPAAPKPAAPKAPAPKTGR